MIQLPRLYNPNPYIAEILHYAGHRVKKIDGVWYYLRPKAWKQMEKSYEGLTLTPKETVKKHTKKKVK